MTARALVVDAATGEIKRKIVGNPAMFALQADTDSGEALFALVEDDWTFVDDANLLVSETGEWEPREGAPEWVTLPGAMIEYVAP